jgi:hypothetical protein
MPATDTMAPLRLLIAAPMLYHPRCGNGGGVLCFELLRHLETEAEVHFVAFGGAPDEDDGAALKALRAVAHSVHVVPRPLPRARGFASMLLQLASGVPRELRDLRSEPMRRRLAEVAATAAVDCVVLQFPHMAQYAAALSARPVVVDVQDACIVSRYREWRSSQAAGQSWGRQWQRLHSWWAWGRHELRDYASAHRLMALSDTDLGVLRAFLPQVPAFLSPVAWETVSSTALAPRSGGPVLLMGNFAHAPNADGLRWLLGEVWPRVRAQCPQARLQLAGRHLPTGLVDNPSIGLEVLGFVDDVQPLLAGAAVSLVPYRFGGGIKIKALEAMAQGCPVVATRVGSEGLGAVDAVHLRVADEPEDFAAAVVGLLQSPGLREQLAKQALALVSERFSWSRKVDQLMLELQGLVREHAALGALRSAGRAA